MKSILIRIIVVLACQLVIINCTKYPRCIEELINAPQLIPGMLASDCNVICFGNYFGNDGDVEGRLCVRKNATLPNYSVGHGICTVGLHKNSCPTNFSLVVGQDLFWENGELNPNGGHIGCPNDPVENMFVGGNITISPGLIPRRRGPCTQPGCLDGGFDLVYQYFKNLSASFSATKDNAKYYLKPGGEFVIQPFDTKASRYYLSFNTTILGQIFSINLKSTNPNAQLIFTVTGDSDAGVQFGAQIIMVAEKVLWNIPGTRTLLITNGLNGSVLAPDATSSILNGAVTGYFITSDIISANQMNFPKFCFADRCP